MEIDVGTERIMRKVLYAAIKDDDDDFEAQLETLAAEGSIADACTRAADLAALMMLDKYGGIPSEETIVKLTENTARLSLWSETPATDFTAYITAIFEQTKIQDVLPIGTALRIPFIQCAHLLVMWREEDEHWYDYLDRLWEVLETRSNPSR
jgi:hypothetical protein